MATEINCKTHVRRAGQTTITFRNGSEPADVEEMLKNTPVGHNHVNTRETFCSAVDGSFLTNAVSERFISMPKFCMKLSAKACARERKKLTEKFERQQFQTSPSTRQTAAEFPLNAAVSNCSENSRFQRISGFYPCWQKHPRSKAVGPACFLPF